MANMRTERRKVKPQQPSADGFTLIEMLTVVAIIALLAIAVLGIAGYARRSTDINRTRVEIQGMGAAIESYKADFGQYPYSTIRRVASYTDPYWWCQYSNSWFLHKGLATQGKLYFKFRPSQLQSPAKFPSAYGTSVLVAEGTLILDPWGKPYGYFFPTELTNLNLPWERSSCTKYNEVGYDLWSNGPDRTHNFPPGAVDDITNW